MAKQSRKAPAAVTTDRWRVLGPAVLILVTLICYWTPMTSSGTSIQWDAADYYQPVQTYLSQELHSGRIPLWTNFPWAGYPFLADPQVGAWYPLNWPFFAIGVGPRLLVVEHWLHSLLACFGMYFLALRLLRNRPAAAVAGLCYGLGGFYAGHSSHTTMLQCAASTPWLLLLLERAAESRPVRNTLLGGIAAGMMILAGHFQTILYSFLALALYAAARTITMRERWMRLFGAALAMALIGTAISAIGTLPGLELTVNSVRASLAAVTRTEGLLTPGSLATLVAPNFYGVFSDRYQGPEDITQYYFYAGILLVPLACFGWKRPAVRWAGLLLIVPTVWYAMGHSAGLYLLVSRLPGFSSVRAPVNIWFVPAMGLALLAAAGAAVVAEKWRFSWLPAAIVAVVAMDLIYWNFAENPLAYARVGYEEIYGAKEDLFRKAVTNNLPPLTRFDAPEHLPTFGPLSHYYDLRTEVTYGYGPLMLARYSDYIDAMRTNLALRNGLNVSRWLDAQAGAVRANGDALPRAMFPKELAAATSDAESKARLTTLEQARQAIIPGSIERPAQDAGATASIREYEGGHYRIHYRCAAPSVLRVSGAYFPGWRAEAGGRSLAVFPVDHALIGVLAPAGEGDLTLDYHSTYLRAGAIVSLLALLACFAALFIPRVTGRNY